MLDAVLAVMLLICAITDLMSRKIYNVVLLPALLFAIGYNGYQGGWPGLGHSLLGMLVGLLILIVPFAKGGMGAGDVKLLAVVGALKGIPFVVYAAIGMGLAGGVMAIGIWFYRLGFMKTISGIFTRIWLGLATKFKGVPMKISEERIMVPYGLAIALGTAGAWWWVR